MKRILVACEESQAVTKELRKKWGHEAFSCDLLPCSGGHPEWHFQEDIFKVIDKGWDIMIAHPPCTYLAVSGARWMYHPDDNQLPFNERRPHPKHPNRRKQQADALDFVQRLMDAPIAKIAIENPISVISSKIRKPDQIVHPWMFGDKASKSTCLWLKNLPELVPTDIVDKGEFVEFISKKGVKKKQPKWYFDALKNAKSSAERSTLRSKTFKGLAQAMANQWT
tara:strand:- start:1136 stop:1807 length:672 start_codon:yes stop_codon:yes gene_type:complete